MEPERKKGFDEARYYNGEQFELGGENFGAVDDKDIEESALNILERNDFSHVSVSVGNCEIILTGAMTDEEGKKKAETLLKDIPKVKKIVNNISVHSH